MALSRLRLPTSGTRGAVWLFVALSTILGLSWAFAGGQRFTSATWDAMKVTPGGVHTWGAVLLVCAACKTFALLYGRAELFTITMCVAGGVYSGIALLFAVPIFLADTDTASLSGWAWPAFVAGAHFATLSTTTRHREL